jgi:hypothetical protein
MPPHPQLALGPVEPAELNVAASHNRSTHAPAGVELHRSRESHWHCAASVWHWPLVLTLQEQGARDETLCTCALPHLLATPASWARVISRPFVSVWVVDDEQAAADHLLWRPKTMGPSKCVCCC